jgi:hypothetical protein
MSRLRFVFLSFRPFVSDFRRHLIAALRLSGHPSAHILLKRGAMAIEGGEGLTHSLNTLAEVKRTIRDFLGARRGIIVNSVGNSAPDIILGLWLDLRDYPWVYDVYDRFLYDATGWKRTQWWLTDRIYRSISSCCCLLSKDLAPYYPRSFHLENASHLRPGKHKEMFDWRVLVIASFDQRTDFDFLCALAAALPELTIDLYGSVYDNDPRTVLALNHITAGWKNVRYHGRYEMDDVQQILDHYLVGLVPYRAAHEMTRFINPDKLFHYLCAGLEVVTSPIPAIRSLRPYVHEASNVDAAAAAIRRIGDRGERRNCGNLHELLNWQIRAREFVGHVKSYLRAREARDQRRA